MTSTPDVTSAALITPNSCIEFLSSLRRTARPSRKAVRGSANLVCLSGHLLAASVSTYTATASISSGRSTPSNEGIDSR